MSSLARRGMVGMGAGVLRPTIQAGGNGVPFSLSLSVFHRLPA